MDGRRWWSGSEHIICILLAISTSSTIHHYQRRHSRPRSASERSTTGGLEDGYPGRVMSRKFNIQKVVQWTSQTVYIDSRRQLRLFFISDRQNDTGEPQHTSSYSHDALHQCPPRRAR